MQKAPPFDRLFRDVKTNKTTFCHENCILIRHNRKENKSVNPDPPWTTDVLVYPWLFRHMTQRVILDLFLHLVTGARLTIHRQHGNMNRAIKGKRCEFFFECRFIKRSPHCRGLQQKAHRVDPISTSHRKSTQRLEPDLLSR